MAEARFQRASPCKFCENPAQYQCQNCDDPLCISCKQLHEREKPHHKYVPYSQKSRTICTRHTDFKYIYWCERCKEACCTKCAITTHKGHGIADIENAKRDELKEHLQGSYNDSLKEWQSLCLEARQMTNEYRAQIQKIDDQLVSHAARIHEAVDKNLAKVRRKIQEISKSTEVVLHKQEQEINDRWEEIKRIYNKAEYYVDSNDVSILLECKFEPANIAALPVLDWQSPPSYSLGQINDQTIMTMIGQLNSINQRFNDDDFSNIAQATATVKRSPQPSSTPTILLSKPVLVSSFNPGCSKPYIVCTTSSGLAWVKTRDRCLQLMDRHGTVKDTIGTHFEFVDVTVNLHGDVLFTDYDHRRIMSASKEATLWRVKSFFSTKYEPCGICCLRNNDVIVTHPWCPDHPVIHYNKNGDVVYQYDSDLLSFPYRAAVNKFNGNLCISDVQKRKIFVFGKDHSLLYQYTGCDRRSLDPREVSTDTSGRVLIADIENDRIHILDKDGKFIRYLQPPGLTKPCYVNVDSEGNVWIWEYKRQVKIIKYQ